MVPNVTVDNKTINGSIVTLILSWGEPFNNLDPIVNYTVSCSRDFTCFPSFNTTINTVTITNLAIMTTYTFSVEAINSIGSGEAGVVMIVTPSGEDTDTLAHIHIFTVCTYSLTYLIECTVASTQQGYSVE